MLLAVLAASVAGAATWVPVGPGAPRAAAPAVRPDDGDRVVYAPPVVAPVVDPFRPPAQPWLPGNRGIEYATAAGTAVRAAGRGRVSFAGPVAGSLHVTVSHPDGIRTSYSHLASIAVVAGAEVQRGHALGTTGPRLHVGARRGDVYIDPASLWGATGPPWVRLAPLERRAAAGRCASPQGWWCPGGRDLDSSVGPGTRSGHLHLTARSTNGRPRGVRTG